MFIIILIGIAMLSSFITLTFHCLIILAKESDEYWEDDEIMKNEETEE